MLGSLFGSLLRAACALGHPSAALSARAKARRLALIGMLFPILDFKFGLLRALVIGDLELQILRANTFLEANARRPAIGALVRSFAIEQCDQLVLAGSEIADVEALHAALEQSGDLARRVQIVTDLVAVNFQ